MATLGAAPTAPITTPQASPDLVALPQALQQQFAAPAPSQPQSQQTQVQQPQAQQPTAYDPMQDAELARFMVDMDQQPPAQTYGFTPQPGAPMQQMPQMPQMPQPGAPTQQMPQPGAPTIDAAALARIEAAQQQMLTALQAAGTAQAQQPAPTQPVPGALDFSVALQAAELTQEERQFFAGKEALFEKLVQNVAKAQIEPALKKLAENAERTYGRLSEVERNSMTQQQMTTRQMLSARIPDFEQILTQPAFASFLNEVLPEVGVTRGEIVRAAVKRGDIGLIGTHVASYKQRYGAAPDGSQALQTLQQPSAQPRAPQPAAGRVQRRVTEETLMQAEAEMLKGRLTPDKFEKLVAVFRGQLTEAAAAQPTQTAFRSA